MGRGMCTAVQSMKEKDALTFRRGDAAAIASVVAIALVMLAFFLLSLSGKEAAFARIYQNGKMIREVRLSENAVLEIGGEYLNEITVRGGEVAVTRSTCPGEDCVHSGWMHSPGRSIVCLPNRLEIRLEGTGTDPEVDAVVQ